MKLLAAARYIPFALLTTFLYTSLILLEVTPGPSWLDKHIRYVSHGFHEHIILGSTTLSTDPSIVPPTSPSRLTWLNAIAESASLVGRTLSQVDLRRLNEVFISEPRGAIIGGTWAEHLARLNNTGLVLPTTVVFAPTQETQETPGILPSSNNGYLNSRIDLRRRKRAFDSQPVDHIGSPIASLYLREDAVFQPRNVDESTLVRELQQAVKRNRKMEQELASRKLRKARKKKKGAAAKKNV